MIFLQDILQEVFDKKYSTHTNCYYIIFITVTATTPVNCNAGQKEDVTRVSGTISSVPLPPPPSCWGENRAKFSDVVARSQEIVSPFSNLNHNVHKSQTSTSGLSTVFSADNKDIQYAKPPSTQELLQTRKEYSLISKAASLSTISLDKDKILNPDSLILQSGAQHSNSYFINTFAEHSVSYN